MGGIPFTRGPLAHLLRNRFYIGEARFKGETLAGKQPAIVDKGLFEAVQAKLNEQVTNHKVSRTKSEALLSGRIYDDRGHRMTPSHARRRGIKYRYYILSALLQGRPKQELVAGSRLISRFAMPASAMTARSHAATFAGTSEGAFTSVQITRCCIPLGPCTKAACFVIAPPNSTAMFVRSRCSALPTRRHDKSPEIFMKMPAMWRAALCGRGPFSSRATSASASRCALPT